MRIVAGYAPHRVAGFFLAHALRQRLHLTERAHPAPVVAYVNKIPDEVGEILACLEFIEMASRLLNRDISFQVALHADLVAALRRELRGIDDRAGIRGVKISGPVATLARDSAVRVAGE